MESALTIGIPGAGKTHRAMELIALCQRRGVPLGSIGFSTFTRAARREASSRAAELFGESIETLERVGWFRTLHSSVMRCLGMVKGELVNGDRDWFTEHLGEYVNGADLEGNDGGWSEQFEGQTPVAICLRLWDVARQRLCSFEEVLRIANQTGELPIKVLQLWPNVIHDYETAKIHDGRADFTDFLLRYAGVRMTIDGPEAIPPAGIVPDVAVWILDEMQDTSPLMATCMIRLTSRAMWRYVFLDPLQEIYTWSGASAKEALGWTYGKREQLKKSWRCSQAILSLALALITRGNEYAADLDLACLEPASIGGSVSISHDDDFIPEIKTDVRTLVMARTNREAHDLGKKLSAACVPWRSNKTGARWPALAVSKRAEAMLALECGKEISAVDWRRIVLDTPAELLARGVKTASKQETYEEAEKSDAKISLRNLVLFGATEAFRELIASNSWRGTICNPDDDGSLAALVKWGDVAKNPRIIVSTIHGTKGMEAEEVFLDTSITLPVVRALTNESGREQERRVWYTGITRARSKLTLIKNSRARSYQEIYDCM